MYVANYANATTEFLGSMFKELQETDEYYVVVRNNNTYNSVNDIAGEEVYAFQVSEDVQDELKNEVNITFGTSDGLTNLGNNLLNREINVIFVSSSQYSMLSEEIENFTDNTNDNRNILFSGDWMLTGFFNTSDTKLVINMYDPPYSAAQATDYDGVDRSEDVYGSQIRLNPGIPAILSDFFYPIVCCIG